MVAASMAERPQGAWHWEVYHQNAYDQPGGVGGVTGHEGVWLVTNVQGEELQHH